MRIHHFAPPTTEFEPSARGRNGTFIPYSAEVSTYTDSVWLFIRSKRSGGNSPINVALTRDDMRALATMLLEACDEQTMA